MLENTTPSGHFTFHRDDNSRGRPRERRYTDSLWRSEYEDEQEEEGEKEEEQRQRIPPRAPSLPRDAIRHSYPPLLSRGRRLERPLPPRSSTPFPFPDMRRGRSPHRELDYVRDELKDYVFDHYMDRARGRFDHDDRGSDVDNDKRKRGREEEEEETYGLLPPAQPEPEPEHDTPDDEDDYYHHGHRNGGLNDYDGHPSEIGGVVENDDNDPVALPQ